MTVAEHPDPPLVEPVETKAFLDVFADKTGGNHKVQTSDYLKTGKFPIVDQGRLEIAGYSNDQSLVAAPHGPVIIFGDHTRILKYVEGPFILGADGTKVLVPKIDADVRFLFQYLRFVDIPSVGYSRHFKFLKEVRIPLPPLPEQRRIAAILDKADNLRTQRREALAYLNDLTQSIFHSMFAGLDLLPSKQPLSSLVPPGDRINYGVVQPGDDLPGGVPLIRVGDLKNGYVSSSNIKHIAPEIESQYARSRINGTEILVSCVGTIGEIAITRPTEIGMNVARAVARVPIAEHDKRVFVAEYLRTEEVQRYFTSELRTVSQPTLNIRQILETPVAVPPLELLQIFATRVAGVERLKERHRTQLSELDALFASLQHRAFKGEL